MILHPSSPPPPHLLRRAKRGANPLPHKFQKLSNKHYALFCSVSPLHVTICFPLLGQYCPAGTNSTRPCIPGTFNPSLGLGSASQCLGCTPGQFCAGWGLNQTSGNCSAGYYCAANATQPNPPGDASGMFVFYISYLIVLRRVTH